MKQHDMDAMGILETKLGKPKLDWIIGNKFGDLMQINNFATPKAGRILDL